MASNLLQIYDAGARTPIWHAKLVEQRDDASVSLGVTSARELREQLTKLLADGKTFGRVVFSTHGKPGIIYIGDDPIAYFSFSGDPDWTGAGYDKLFPYGTKIVFGACNVASGEDGWKFLERAGKLFLRQGGGYTLGWDSLGFSLWGHDVHFWGGYRQVLFRPGGSVIGRQTNERTDLYLR